MPTFKIYGAHADTGKELSVSVQAESPTEAEAIAWHRRILVERVVEVESAATQVLIAAPAAPPAARMPQAGHPTSSVPGHSAYAPTLNVNLPKRSSSLGIVSLILGIVALLICWIPFIGILSIPISGLGLLLAVIGFFVAVARKGGGIGWPIGGGLLTGIALLIGVSQVAVIGGAAKAISDSEQKRLQTNQQSVPPGGAGRQRGSPAVPPTNDVKQWASAENAVRQGDAELHITSVAVSTVQMKEAFGDDVSSSKEPQLVIKVELRNISETKKLNYRTWAGGDFSFGRDFATLQDNFGNTYKRVTFGSMRKPIGRVESDSIYPGKSLTDVLIFEPPLDKAEYLNLELPGENVGGEGMLRIRIPAKMVKRSGITSPAPATTQPQVAGVKVANPAEVPLVLDDWDYKVTKGDFGQEYYRISLRLRNAGAKQIKLIDASVRFTDLLDQSLYGVEVSPDIAIAPGKMQIEEGDYSINQFINEQSRMKNMKKADIKATLQVRRIVFSDNTVLQVER